MRSEENRLKILNPDAENLPRALGISKEREDQIVKRVDQIIKDNSDGEKIRNLQIIADVYNEFEKRAENAFAMYIISGEERDVVLNSMFGNLTQSVGS